MSSMSSPTRLFVSYASVDRERVRVLADELMAAGFDVWLDVDGIAAGESYGPEIAEGIRSAHAVVLMSSVASLASRNVRQEIQLAWKYDRPILPVLLETLIFPDDLAYWLEGAQWIDLNALADGEWIARIRSTLNRRGILADPEPVVSEPTLAAPPIVGNLPRLEHSPLGRDQEIRRLISLIGNSRLVTITGPGGVGKTTLAITACRALNAAFPAGTWFVDCAATTRGDEILDVLRATVRPMDDVAYDNLDDIARSLGSTPSLLVLDNLEQNPDAASVVGRLRDDLPQTHLVITSRVALRVAGEATVAIAPFSLPAPDQTGASELAQSAAVAMFVARAREARPDFVLTDGNARAVADICTRLDGIPLGIELAAARCRMLPPAAIRDRLDTALALRDRSNIARDARQQTLRDTIAWSYELLDADQQHTLRAASRFEQGFFAEALEAVSPTTDPLDDLDALLDHHLVVRDLSWSSIDEPRFRMLETIRQFATEKRVELDDPAAGETAYLAHMQTVAERGGSALESGSDASAALLLEADHANLRSAMDVALNHDREAAAVLGQSLWRFWLARGHLREGIGFLDQALAAPVEMSNSSRSRLLQARAVLRETRGDLGGARDDWAEAVATAEGEADHKLLAAALGGLGTASEAMGDLAAASDTYQRALTIHRETGNKRGLAACLHYLGSIALMQGDLEEAAERNTESLALWRELGEMLPLAYAIQQAGIIAFLNGAYDSAVDRYTEALTLAETLGDRTGIGNAWLNLGSAQEMSGLLADAVTSLDHARTEFGELDDQGGVGYVDYLLGHVARVRGDLNEAFDRLRSAQSLLTEVGDLASLALVHETLAGIAVDRSDPAAARTEFDRAQQLRSETGAALPASRASEVERDLTALGLLEQT